MTNNVVQASFGASATGEVTGKLIVSVAGDDLIMSYEDLGLNFDSAESDILGAVRPVIRERFGQDIAEGGGRWLYKTRKAVESRNIHLIPNSTAGAENALSYLSNEDRLKAYDTITHGCMHLWSKNKLQEEKLKSLLETFGSLAEKDPLFLAHFTSYAVKKLDSKDLKVVLTFLNSLSDADGTPFSPGSEFKKPNWRLVSQAALQQLDPKLALRVVELANLKVKVGTKTEATHYSKHLLNGLRKYLRYRESNPKALQGVKKAGLGKTVQKLYRRARLAPSPDAAATLRWKQKEGYPGHGVALGKSMFDFKGLTDLQIAEKIRAENLAPTGVLGALPDKISPVIAAAILEQSSGDQAVVLTSLFEDQGLLKNKEVQKVYTEKLKTAKTALDRVERIKQDLGATADLMKEVKSEKRKEDMGDFGKVFVHIDTSSSMHQAIAIAKDRGATIAEFVQNPEENFHWGLFNSHGTVLPRPAKFTKDAFAAALYGRAAGGSTNIMALYEKARELGCLTDVYLTDQEQTNGPIEAYIDRARAKGLPDPRLVIIVHIGHSHHRDAQVAFERKGIPVVVLKPEQLAESALVTQAVRTAFKGQMAVIEEIMNEPLLELPKWWCAVKAA